MSVLPKRRKAVVLVFRRGKVDEVLVAERTLKGKERTVPLSTELADRESWEAAARRVARAATGTEPVAFVDLTLVARYEVKDGPNAGAWTERTVAAEVAPGTAAQDATWLPHYDAKARFAEPRQRDAVTGLRAQARLKP